MHDYSWVESTDYYVCQLQFEFVNIFGSRDPFNGSNSRSHKHLTFDERIHRQWVYDMFDEVSFRYAVWLATTALA